MSQDAKSLDLGDDFRKVLNRHGYAFQYSVIKYICELRGEGRSLWDFQEPEFPVSVGELSTRIDFVLRKAKPHVYLIGECKRVNPAFSDWCFAGSSYARGNSVPDKTVFQYAWVAPLDVSPINIRPLDPTPRFRCGIESVSGSPVYYAGRAVKTKSKGDSNGKTSDEIEDAAGQVCKGLNGLIEVFHGQVEKLPGNEKMFFLPVIFTTARIWTTDVDLASADIEKGEFESGAVTVTERPWIWYQYNLSPDLKHSVANESGYTSPFDLTAILDQEFKRSIAIVSVKGIEEFLNHGFPLR